MRPDLRGTLNAKRGIVPKARVPAPLGPGACDILDTNMEMRSLLRPAIGLRRNREPNP